MKNFDTEDELYIVVMRRFASEAPRLHKALNDRFYLTPQEAWEVAKRENEDQGGPFWTVIVFHGQVCGEFETKEDVDNYCV